MIAAQMFEVIRDRIGVILSNTPELGEEGITRIDVENSEPYDVNPGIELPLINIYLKSIDYFDSSPQTSTGLYTYSIVAFVAAKGVKGNDFNPPQSGSIIAMLKAQRIIGICRAALMKTANLDLGIKDGNYNLISGRKATRIYTDEYVGNRDSNQTVIFCMDFEVRAYEQNILELGENSFLIGYTLNHLSDENGFYYNISD